MSHQSDRDRPTPSSNINPIDYQKSSVFNGTRNILYQASTSKETEGKEAGHTRQVPIIGNEFNLKLQPSERQIIAPSMNEKTFKSQQEQITSQMILDQLIEAQNAPTYNHAKVERLI